MSITLSTIDLSTATQPYTVVIPSNLQLNQIGWIEFLNESPYKISLIAGSVNIPITAWLDYPVQVSNNNVILAGFSLPLVLSWMLLTNVDNVPTSLDIVVYFRGETPSSTSPFGLTRQVASTVVNAVAVTNTGFPAGTPIVSGQPAGDTNFPTLIYNSGSAIFGDSLHSGSVQVLDTGGNATSIQGPNIQLFNNSGGFLEIALSSVSVNGGVSGSATLWQDFQGNIKRTLILLNAFRTGASAQQLIFPTPYTAGCFIRVGNTGTSATNAGISLLNGASLQNMQLFVTLSATGNAGTTATSIFSGTNGECESAFDRVQFQASGTVGHTGFIEIVGQ